MNTFTTIISCALAAGSFAYIFIPNHKFMYFVAIMVVILLITCFKLESLFATKENDIINRIIYYLTPDDKQ